MANPNVATGTDGFCYPNGANAGVTGLADVRRMYIEVGTFTITDFHVRNLLENLGAGDTYTVELRKNGTSVGSVTFADGDAVGLLRTATINTTVTAGDFLTVVYTQTDLLAQDNRFCWEFTLAS